MKRLPRIFCLFTVLAGGIGMWMLKLLYAAADVRGLIPRDHPGNLSLLMAAGAVGLMVLFFLWKGDKGDFRSCVKLPVDAVGSLVAAFAFLYSVLTFYEGFHLLMAVRLVAVGCFGALAFFQFQKKKPPLVICAVLCAVAVVQTFEQLRGVMSFTQPQRYLIQGVQTVFFALYMLYYTLLQVPERNNRLAFACNLGALFTSMVCIASEGGCFYLGLSLWILSGQFFTPYAMRLPGNVQNCIRSLENAGYTAYVVGGCVRDALMGNDPHDYDLCTSATPEQICQVFSGYNLVRNGEKHGTIGVVMDGTVYEITTYRTEGGYEDNRHPDWVEFVDQVEADLARRDFTVNAMAYHPTRGYVDPYGGRQDLYDGVIRSVGDASSRFREDALRILRGVRFACRFRFTVESATLQAMEELAPLMDNLAKERLLSEMTQILCHMEADDLLTYKQILLQVVPELAPCVGFLQHNRHHKYDVFTHTAYVLTATVPEPALRWAALLHDAGKPEVFTRDEKGQGHFYGHAQVSAKLADQVLHRLKASTALREQVVFLIAHHMDEIKPDAAVLRRKLSKYGLKAMRLLIGLQYADQGSKGTGGEDRTLEKIDKLLLKLHKEEGRLQIRDLAVNGHDLMELGFAPGPVLGECQKKLLEQVLSGELPNEKQALLAKASEFLNEQ